MAGNIKGITIEIDGNTMPLQKALNNVNKEVRDTQKELREVDRLLKLDPKNVELLTQKQKLLDKAVQDINKKLDTEKEALKALQEADQSEEVTRKMGQLESQIKKDEEALLKARKAVNDFGDVGKQQALAVNAEFEKMGKTIKEKGDQIQEIGKNITTHVTAPIMAVGGAALAAFNEVDKGYDIVIKKTGAAGDAAQEMYDIVDNLVTSIPTDFETAGSAVGEVNTRFGLTGDALGELSEQFIKFAKLNDTDVSTSIDEVQKALSAFGMGAEEAEGLLDQLNATGQATGVSVDTLTSGLIQNGTAFQELGLDIDQSVALMGELEKSGANGETVMQGLRKALKSAAKDGKPLNEALTDLQDTIENGTDDMDGLTAAYELFGKSGDQIYGAVKNGSLDFRNLGESAGDAAGSVSDTFETTLSPMDQWAMTLNELKLAGAALGSTVGELLVPAIQKVGEVVEGLRAKWEELSPEQQEMIVQMAGIAAVIGPIVAIIGPIVAIIGSIVSGIGGLITSMTAIAAVFGTTIGVVAGVAAGIAALIAVIVLLITHWDQVKAKVKEAWENISAYVGQLKDDVKAKFDEMKQNVQDKIQQIKQDMQDKWNQIKQDAVDKVVGMKNDIVNKLIELKASAVEKLNDIKSKFKEKFDDIKEKVKGVVDDIKGFFDGMKLKLPKIEMPKLPHFSLTGEFSLHPPSVPHISVDWNAKAMNQPYVFTQPTVMQTPYGYIGAGEAGKEIMYGYDSLMRDITAANAANNSALERGVYNAMVAALQTGDFTIQIGNREFARILREAGAL